MLQFSRLQCHDDSPCGKQNARHRPTMGVLDMTLAHLAPKDGDANSGAASGQRARSSFSDKTQA